MPGSTSLLASSIQQLVRQVQDLTVTAMECGLKDLKMTAGVQHLPGSQVLQPPAPAAYAWQPSLPTSAPTGYAGQSGMAASQGRPWVPASSVAFPGQVPPGFGGAPMPSPSLHRCHRQPADHCFRVGLSSLIRRYTAAIVLFWPPAAHSHWRPSPVPPPLHTSAACKFPSVSHLLAYHHYPGHARPSHV